jgi:hypothetical protein
MNRFCVSALALAALAGAANAQQVTFQIYERTGQSVANTADALLEIGIRAKVTGGQMLGGYNFDLATNDAESSGTLARAKTMIGNNPAANPPGNYYFTGSPWTAGNTLGVHGLAGQYTYLAGISSQFNGQINTSAGTFTNNPAINEIGLIAGAATGSSLLQTPGIDTDGDGNPDTAPSNTGTGGSGNPSNGEIAQVTDPTIRGPYFADNQFIDVYRFRYTVTNFTSRTIHFDLAGVGAQFFTQLLYNNGAWGAENLTALPNQITVQGLDVAVTPTPASVALLGLGGLMVARRRRA